MRIISVCICRVMITLYSDVHNTFLKVKEIVVKTQGT